MYSQNANEGYKRLTRTIDLSSATAGELSFWTSYNTEAGWDFMFVEAHEVGQDDWTTLPDANGHTSQDVGASCPSGWIDQLHNHLGYYQTFVGGDPITDADDTCLPTGSLGSGTGEWHAASGDSAGWQEWRVDLSRSAGKQVEVSIVFATDWATLVVPGALVDDTTVTVNGSPVAQTSFEEDMGGWTVPGAHPAGPSTNVNDWIRRDRIPFEDAAVTKTQFGLLFGFGFEGVDTAAKRADLMGRTIDYLLD